jgi:hypothetical protein
MKKAKFITFLLVICMLLTILPTASALQPILLGNLSDATYLEGEAATPLSAGIFIIGTTFQWQSWSFVLHNWMNILGATDSSYTPPTTTAGTREYRYVSDNGGTIHNSASVTITVLKQPVLSVAPATQTLNAGGQASFMASAANIDGWDLTHSYWAWGPIPDPAGITGDYSAGGSISMTSISQVLNNPGVIYYFYVGEYIDTANGTKTIKVFSNGAKAIVNAVVQPPQPQYTNPFVDVHSTDWFYVNVMDAVQMGLINGTTPTTYSPNANLSIASAIKLAACMYQYYNTGVVTLANSPGNWYDSYVNYAVANGIISSSAYAGRYNDNATRADYVKIFYYALPASEYAQVQNVTPGAIPDVAVTDTYGAEVYAFYRAGILQGNDAYGTFAPASYIRRSEVAAIISRMMTPTNRITTAYPWL